MAPQLKALAVTLPESAHKILELEAERLGYMYHGRGTLIPLLLHYASMFRNKPVEMTKRRTHVPPRKWKGHKRDKQAWLPIWAIDTLRKRALNRGFINRQKNGDVNALLLEHAAMIAIKTPNLPTVDEWRYDNTPLP
jgi:hypothetical protein